MAIIIDLIRLVMLLSLPFMIRKNLLCTVLNCLGLSLSLVNYQMESSVHAVLKFCVWICGSLHHFENGYDTIVLPIQRGISSVCVNYE